MSDVSDSASEGATDGLVASQWFDRLAPCVTEVPERRLLLAVLVDAIRCLQDAKAEHRTQAAAWIRGENGNARLLFQDVCDGLGFDVVGLRRRLLSFATADAERIHQHRIAARPRALRVGRKPRPLRHVAVQVQQAI